MKKLYPKLIAVASDVKMTEEVKNGLRCAECQTVGFDTLPYDRLKNPSRQLERKNTITTAVI